jgi:hypothetical protein
VPAHERVTSRLERAARACKLRAVGEALLETTRRALEQLAQDKPAMKALVAIALKRSESVADAEEFVSEAIARLYAGSVARDAVRHPDLVRQLGSIVNGLARNKATSAAVRHEAPPDSERTRRTRDGAPTAEEVIVAHDAGRETAELLARRMAALRERLAEIPLALELLVWFERGTTTPEELVGATGRGIEDVRRALRRIYYHAEAVVRGEAAQ